MYLIIGICLPVIVASSVHTHLQGWEGFVIYKTWLGPYNAITMEMQKLEHESNIQEYDIIYVVSRRLYFFY